MKTLPLYLLLPLAAACHVSMARNRLVVDGVELHEHHHERLEVQAWTPTGLRVESHVGDVRVEPPAQGEPITIEAVVHEHSLGDGYVVLEDSRLLARSRSGLPAALGEVVVRTSELPCLYATSGSGDVSVIDVLLQGPLDLETGMGDILVRNVGAPERLTASTGMGGVDVKQVSPVEIVLESGMGDIELRQVLGEHGTCSSGMGDVELSDCSFVRLDASTGMGDIECVRTSYEQGELDTGMGKVSREGAPASPRSAP